MKSCKELHEHVPTRYVVYFMLFTGSTIIYAMRTDVNVAIIAMVKATHNNATSQCPYPLSETGNSSSHSEGELDWDEYTQGIVLSSFFWGYICSCIPGGILSQKYSAKWVAGIGVLCTAICSCLCPVAARAGPWQLVSVRIIKGLSEGGIYSAFYHISSQWSPPYERSIASTLLHVGESLGIVIAAPVAASLVKKTLDNGWPLIFYCFGSLGILWVLVWTFVVFDSPRAHPNISQKERTSILTSLDRSESMDTEMANTKRSFPWFAALKSLPVWGLAAACLGYKWGYYTLFTLLPTYMEKVLHFDLAQGEMYATFPPLALLVISVACGFLMDYFIKRNAASVGKLRKIAHVIGNIVPGLLFISVPFLGCDKPSTLAVLTILAGVSGVHLSGSFASIFDYTPNNAGTLFGILNTLQTVAGILAPYVAGYLTEGNPSVAAWGPVFYISAAFHFGGTIIFLILAGEVKPLEWDAPEK